ncbi:hypothetical protein DFR39_103424 [Roseateles asaccharophilus]|uniref:Uncharacterized protein n=1 Tax=Roseateles asaccharophilus TaxID=582607 RepID=A0A4V3CJZ0_9BURK|nr:hypothetical protein DFR39_103424 [Roseateles asaccharophilus]
MAAATLGRQEDPDVKIMIMLAASCALLGCSSTEVSRVPIEATVGQQLMDLHKAYQSGALSERDYQKQKRLLIESVQ